MLDALYEPLFRSCSYGFRAGRSPIHALRHVARASRSGGPWIVAGDLERGFESLPHSVILACLRQRIKAERVIDLIRRVLQAGVMEPGQYEQTYSGAPQGGLGSPIWMNSVLHEFDGWREEHWQTNAPVFPRTHSAYARLKRSLTRWRGHLQGRLPMGRQTEDGLRRKIAMAKAARHPVPSYAPRPTLRYGRFADDSLVVMGGDGKAEAHRLQEAMATWLQDQLGLRPHSDHTRITHWSERVRCLGYDLRGPRNLKGTRWARRLMPPEAERDLKQRVKRLWGYTHIPATDLIMSVTAVLRGWTPDYCDASNATRRLGYLTGGAFWLTAHSLGRKHRRSIKRLMAPHDGRDPRTGTRALSVTLPGDNRVVLWHKPPQPRSILSGQGFAHDPRPVMMTAWAGGHREEQRLALGTRYGDPCQPCGQTRPGLVVHHPQRLATRLARKQGPTRVIQAAQEQQPKWLWGDCHRQHHAGGW